MSPAFCGPAGSNLNEFGCKFRNVKSISKALTIIKADYTRHKLVCEVVYSLDMLRFAKMLRDLNLIYGFSLSGGRIVLYLRYVNGQPAISKIRRISRPGARRYVNAKKLISMGGKNPTAISLLSTSSGLREFSAKGCPSRKPAGEFICKIW